MTAFVGAARSFISLFAVASAMLSVNTGASAHLFNSSLAHIVDSSQSSAIVRGNEPLVPPPGNASTGPVFAACELFARMRQLGKLHGILFLQNIGGNQTCSDSFVLGKRAPSQYSTTIFYDFNLLNPNKTDDADSIAREKKFIASLACAQNFGLAGCKFINFALVGSVTSPWWFPTNTALSIAAKLGQPDSAVPYSARFVSAIAALRALFVGTSSNSNAAIYVHCEAGHDRTGAVSAAYAVAYQNYTLADAIALGARIKGKPIEAAYIRLTAWYCYYLAATAPQRVALSVCKAPPGAMTAAPTTAPRI